MLAVCLIAGALAVLLLVLWIVKRTSSSPFGSQAILHEVDLPAFRNLLSREDDLFLRSSLNPAHYRQVRRARLRAVQQYLLWIAGNCAVLLGMLRAQPIECDAGSAETEMLVRSALRLRLICVGFWLLLWAEYVLPHMEIRLLSTIRKYEELWRLGEKYLSAKTPRPAVTSGQGIA